MSDEELLRPGALAPRLVEATGDQSWANFDARLITGGKSNLTYLLSSDAGELVLRRPPSGDLLPTAHDMGREARVQNALADSAVPTANIVLHDYTDETIGAPFYVMDKVEGHVIRDVLPDGYADDERDRHRMAEALIDALVALHQVDYDAVGLGDFGRPEGFLERQVRRWAGQSAASADEIPDLTKLAERLQENVPPQIPGAIVHGDYRLDNCVMDLTDPGRIAAVLDWELSTVGDPLTDLGLALFYWPEAGEPDIPLVPTVTGQGGFPDRATLIEWYGAKSGVDLSRIGWYRAFATFKFTVIVQGVQARVDAGKMGGQTFERVDDDVLRLASEGLDMIKEDA